MLDLHIDQVITAEFIESAYSYEAYRTLIDTLLAENKSTGPNQTESFLEYSKLNVHRMSRLDRTVKISPELQEAVATIDQKWTWLVISEGWCGDAAQNLPVINELAKLNDLIELKVILRDENLDVMDAYLTNGGRSIPKLVALKGEQLEELGTWGPRPAPVQERMVAFKADPQGLSKEDFNIEIQKWYAKDRTKTIQAEMLALIEEWKKA